MKRNPFRLAFFGCLTLGMMILIFILSSQDATESGKLSSWLLSTGFGQALMRILPPLSEKGAGFDLRKYAHMTEYAFLALSSAGFFRELTLEHSPLTALMFSPIFCFLYACSDEIHQVYVPGRTGQFSDVLIDMAGVLAALIVLFLSAALRKERK